MIQRKESLSFDGTYPVLENTGFRAAPRPAMLWFGAAKPGSGGGTGDTDLFVLMEWSQSDSNWGRTCCNEELARALYALVDPSNKEHSPCTFEGASSEAKPFAMINLSFIDTPKIHVSELKKMFWIFLFFSLISLT
jgi:hypothetical protein